MNGLVVALNPKRGVAAVRLSDGDHSIIELVDNDVAVGDSLRWTSQTHNAGGGIVENLTQGNRVSVMFLNHGVHESQITSQLL